MGLEETLALTPALSPRRGGEHAQFPEFSRPLVWNCFMGTHVGCYSSKDSSMLFHTWPFAVFLLIVLPVFFALRKTRLWLPWLTVASYFFYGWWNPYYLFLVVYSTVLDFCLVALMDHCPRSAQKVDGFARLTRLGFDDHVLKVAFVVFAAGTAGSLALAIVGPQTLRPTMAALTLMVLLMAL